MPPTRSRPAAFAVAATAALIAGAMAAPAAAAESPEAAVNQLIDAVEAGDYDSVEALVCETERAAVSQMLDPGEAMGMEEARDLITFAVDGRSVKVLSEDGDEATVRLTGTMSMDMGGGDVEAVAMALLEADMGELSEDDIETMLSYIEGALTRTSPVDEELIVVREDGEWVVCGGLGEPVEEEYGFDTPSNVSSVGVCGLATPEELTAVGPLEYGSSSGWELTQCSYSTADFESYHTATVTVELDTDAAYAASAYGADQELEVAGSPAFTSDQMNAPLIVQVGPDMLNVAVWPPQPEPEGFDVLAQSMAIAELFAPRVAESRADLIEPVKPLLCDLGFASEFEGAMDLPMHSGSVSSDSCNFESNDAVRIRAYVSQGTIDDFLMFYPDSEETTVAGRRALQVVDDFNQSAFNIRVELPGEQVLDVTVEPAAYDKPLSMPGSDVAELLTEHIVAKSDE